ncbi:Uncharacterized protein APZ42_005783, partial [Daphnia magna]
LFSGGWQLPKPTFFLLEFHFSFFFPIAILTKSLVRLDPYPLSSCRSRERLSHSYREPSAPYRWKSSLEVSIIIGTA